MKVPNFRFMAGALAGVLVAGSSLAAEATRSTTAPSRGTSSRSQSTGRGILPDPVLLDGSKQAAEKKTEYGMIGDFEMPGDENANTGKVGGGQGSGQQPPDANGSQGMAMPGGGGQQKDQAGKPSAGQGGAQTAAQEGGGSADPKAAEKQGGGAGEPNAQAQGIKVAELAGDPSGGSQDPSAQQKPSPVSIGDKAMRIPQNTPGASGVVGAQQVAGQNTQVYEKATGTGGKAPTGQQGPNRVEKGRTIPSGL